MNKVQVIFVLFLFTTLFANTQNLNPIHSLLMDGVYHSNGDTTGTSDVWGWSSPSGLDVLIVGTKEGTTFINAITGLELDFQAGPSENDYYFHRDYKTYRNYLFAVHEMTGEGAGIQVFDLSTLPDSTSLVTTYVHAGKERSHNLSIDTLMGYAYVVDQDYQGVRIINVQNGESPVEEGFVSVPATHDVFARNDSLWCAEGGAQAFSIYDVSDKSNPVLLLRLADSTFGYCHSIWPLENGNFFVTTEETDFKTVKIWDCADPLDIKLVSELLAPCSLAHNAIVEGDSIYISHYESGVWVYDISDVEFPVLAGSFDTHSYSEDPVFKGCWGVFPSLSNGKIYTSDIGGRVHVLEWGNPPASTISVDIEELLLFPNPISGFFRLSGDLSKHESIQYSVFNILGEKVASGIVQNGKSQDLSFLKVGVYTILISNTAFSKVFKIVKD